MPLACIEEFWTYSHISFVLGIIIWSFLKAVVFRSMLADSHTADYNGHSIQTIPVSRVILFQTPVSVQLQASSCKTVDGSYVEVLSININVASFLALSLE